MALALALLHVLYFLCKLIYTGKLSMHQIWLLTYQSSVLSFVVISQ